MILDVKTLLVNVYNASNCFYSILFTQQIKLLLYLKGASSGHYFEVVMAAYILLSNLGPVHYHEGQPNAFWHLRCTTKLRSLTRPRKKG